MAFSKRTIVTEITLRFSAEDGAFDTAFRQGITQVLEDGAVVAERRRAPDPLTLAQAKAQVAAL